MIGAIVLTLRHKTGIKRQDPSVQVNRRVADTLEIVKVKSGQGL
jgi:NADH-quinone oxidoreductase subunit J